MDHLKPGIHAIVPLDETKHPSINVKRRNNNQVSIKTEMKPFDIVLLYWPINDAFTNIDSSNKTTLFIRVLHEVCDTVCVPITNDSVE